MKELNYMAIDKDGRFVAVTTANHTKETAKEVAKWIRQGLSVERCDDECVKKYFGDIVRQELPKG